VSALAVLASGLNASALDEATRRAEPAIRVSELTKRYPVRRGLTDVLRFKPLATTTVVDRVSFDINVGEIFGVLGPNGAGKTTLFRMLSTVVVPDEGTVSVYGEDVCLQANAVKRMLAGVSSDERTLNWRLSARENLRMFAALHRVPRHETDERLTSVLRTVGLDSTGRKMVAEFSSGMRQRLLIARALLSRPRVLLLDEPTRALDPISAQEFRDFLRRELVDRQRCTIVLATHNAEEAFGFCDRLIVLNRGRILAMGTAPQLSARFGEDRYRIVTADPDHPCFSRLEALQGIQHVVKHSRSIDGWHVVECGIAGDPSRSAQVLSALLDSGVRVARLERVEPSLADVISRIIGGDSQGPHNA
jgi:ABC-2 type transport system ATP-binding protein